MTVEPAAGCRVESPGMVYLDANSEEQPVAVARDGEDEPKWTFTIPAANAAVTPALALINYTITWRNDAPKSDDEEIERQGD